MLVGFLFLVVMPICFMRIWVSVLSGQSRLISSGLTRFEYVVFGVGVTISLLFGVWPALLIL